MRNMRKVIHGKFGGRCAYCGEEINRTQMAVVYMSMGTGGTGAIHCLYQPGHETPPDISDLMPACNLCRALCSKPSHTDEMREKLIEQIAWSRRNDNRVRLAERHGLLLAVTKPVVFHFEKHVN